MRRPRSCAPGDWAGPSPTLRVRPEQWQAAIGRTRTRGFVQRGSRRAYVECRSLVGLEDVEVVGVIGWMVPLHVHIASRLLCPSCVSCGTPARAEQTMRRRLVDLPVFGQPVATVWYQVRWCCPATGYPIRSWTEVDERIVTGIRGMTDRATRWACEEVGRYGRTVAEVAGELGCDWRSVNRPVIDYGLALQSRAWRPVTTWRS